MRLLGAGSALALAVLLIAGCGSTSSKQAKPAGAEAPQRDAAARVLERAARATPSDGDLFFLRFDRSEARDVIRSVAGGRIAEQQVGSSTDVVRMLLERLGQPPAHARRDARAAGDAIAIASTPTGRLRAFGEQLDTTLPTSIASPARSSTMIAESHAWKAARTQRTRSSSFGLLFVGAGSDDRSTLVVAGSDHEGLWLDGRASAGSCVPHDVPRIATRLARMPQDTDVAIAAATPRIADTATQSGVDLLRRGIAEIVQPRGVLHVSSSVLQRIIGRIDVAARALRHALATAASAAPDGQPFALAVQKFGAARPAMRALGAGDATLGTDPAFARTRGAARIPASADAVTWMDLDAITRTLAASELHGVAAGVAATLATGIDGVLAWHRCDGRVGARIAIDTE